MDPELKNSAVDTMKSNANRSISFERSHQLKSLLKRLFIDKTRLEFEQNNLQSTLSILDEALTHTSAQAPVNHERLEFLGDAVLRLTASEFIDRYFPKMKVGERSALRAQLVSDSWLAKVGERIEIEKLLIIGPKAANDASARATLNAEATEALIGALYESLKELGPIHLWLTPHWIESSKCFFSDPHRQNYKSALQEWSQSKGFKRPTYQVEERSRQHGDPCRFFCKVQLENELLGKGWGGSRREAEKEAARQALEKLNEINPEFQTSEAKKRISELETKNSNRTGPERRDEAL